jgi:hypothetical protein
MTPARLIRTLLPSRPRHPHHAALTQSIAASVSKAASGRCDPISCPSNCRCFAQVNDIDRRGQDVWFSSTAPRHNLDGQGSDHKPPDERKLQLGKTVRVLHERLPTLLQSPLPSDILSPQISLHLFPSTHPHLPTVSGRIGYVAALWTAPVAWGRVPLVGNVKLTILSERMVHHGGSAVPLAGRDEKLVVKWKTCGKTKHRDPTGGVYRGGSAKVEKDPMDRIKDFIAGTRQGNEQEQLAKRIQDEEDQEFCGIFIFEFDHEGRIAKHVIEHTEQGGDTDRMTRVVSVTDWLLGRINGKAQEHLPELALCEERPTGGRIRLVDRRPRFG